MFKDKEAVLEELGNQGPDYLGVAQALRIFFKPEEWTINMWPEDRLNTAVASVTGEHINRISNATIKWPEDPDKRRDLQGQVMAKLREMDDTQLKMAAIGARGWSEENLLKAVSRALDEIARAQKEQRRGSERLPRLMIRAALWAYGQDIPDTEEQIDAAGRALVGASAVAATKVVAQEIDDDNLF